MEKLNFKFTTLFLLFTNCFLPSGKEGTSEILSSSESSNTPDVTTNLTPTDTDSNNTSTTTTYDPTTGINTTGSITSEISGLTETNTTLSITDMGLESTTIETSDSSTGEPKDPSIVFVTSMTFDGNFLGTMSSMKTPDERCQEIAQVVGLEGNFRAWVSYVNDSAFSRMSSIEGKLIRVDGEIFANSLNELILGNPKNPLNINEKGEIFNTEVWTGTLPNGTLAPAGNCGEWQSNMNPFKGYYGVSNTTDAEWTYIGENVVCDTFKALYCFEVKI